MTSKRPPVQKAFTLIELMIVVAIIGILAAVAIPKFADMMRKSREGATKGMLTTLRSAITVYAANSDGTYPMDRLETLIPNYLEYIPTHRLTHYHVAAAAVKNNNDYGMGGMLVMDTGEWLYWNRSDWTLNNKQWGAIWVGCSHTDTQTERITAW